MGADIHLCVEHRTADGSWQRVEPLIPNPHRFPASELQYDRLELVHDTWFDHRNYWLFGVLAGVRGDPSIDPIAEPRGLPPDRTEETAAQCAVWEGDAHTHSWLALAELLAYDWFQPVTTNGWLTAVNLEREAGLDLAAAHVRSTGVVPPGFVLQPHQPARPAAQWDPRDRRWQLSSTGIEVPTIVPLADLVESFFPFVMRLSGASNGDHDAIRIVFWFDN